MKYPNVVWAGRDQVKLATLPAVVMCPKCVISFLSTTPPHPPSHPSYQKAKSHKRHRSCTSNHRTTLVLLGLSPPLLTPTHRIQKDFSSGGKYQVFGHMDEMGGCSWREGKETGAENAHKASRVQICGLKTALVHPHCLWV